MYSIQYPYTPHTPNAGISLYQGTMAISQRKGGPAQNGPGRIHVVWLPSPYIKFEIEIAGGSLGASIGQTVYLAWGNNASKAQVFQTGHQSSQGRYVLTLGGALLPPAKIGVRPSRLLSFSVVNFPRWPTRQGVHFSLGDWQIDLAPSANPSAIYSQLRANGGFCITHVGWARKNTAQPVSAGEVAQLFDELHFLFSLARGAWACPFLPVSFSRTGSQIWQEWDLRNVDTWKGDASWFPTYHPDALTSAAAGLHSRWADPVWTEPLKVAIHLYMESNIHGLTNQSSLTLGQVALELLAWTYFVEDRKQFSASFFDKKLRAADRIRHLLKAANIPTAIPRHLGSLASSGSSLAPSGSWADGPHAITVLRNALVHPPRLPGLLAISGRATLQAWQLTLWYLELAFLWLLNYSGYYSNRLRRFSEQVPP
jgi:hypothetical protein